MLLILKIWPHGEHCRAIFSIFDKNFCRFAHFIMLLLAVELNFILFVKNIAEIVQCRGRGILGEGKLQKLREVRNGAISF